MLEHERGSKAGSNSKYHGNTKRQKEDSYCMEDGREEHISPMKLAQSPRQMVISENHKTNQNFEFNYSLIHNNTHSIVKQTLAKYECIKFRINFILVENSQNGDRICSR